MDNRQEPAGDHDSHTIVHGMGCTWWGYPHETNLTHGLGIPVCPHCKHPLLQTSAEQWTEEVAAANKRHKGYADYIMWLRTQSRCYKSLQEGINAYRKATGRPVHIKWRKRHG